MSRNTDGAAIPEGEREQNLKDIGEWVGLLKTSLAMPIRGGKSVTAKKVDEYSGALAKQSPGLKFGFAHEVLPAVSMEEASKEKVTSACLTLEDDDFAVKGRRHLSPADGSPLVESTIDCDR